MTPVVEEFPVRAAFGFASLLLLATLVPAPPARAEWPAGLTLESVPGSWVGGLGGIEEGFVFAGPGPGQLYAVGKQLAYTAWGAQGFDTQSQGEFLVSLPQTSSTGISDRGCGFAPDGAGGLLDLYPDMNGTVRTWHVDASGVATPGLDVPGPMVDTVSAGFPVAVAAPGGGAWYAWQRAGIRLMRVGPDGTRLAPWPERGLRVPGLSNSSALLGFVPGLANDGQGGVLVASTDSVLRVQRVGPDTALVPGWPATGLQLRHPGSASFYTPRTTFVPSGADHFIACWIEYGVNTDEHWCQRFGLDGTIDPAWPAQGLLVGTCPSTGEAWMFRCFADDGGGVTMTWVLPNGTTNTEDVHACRVLADGTFPQGYWGGAKLLASVPRPLQGPDAVAVCRGRGNGLIVIWMDPALGMRGRWYADNRSPDPDLDHDESDLNADTDRPGRRAAVAALSDGDGGAYLLFCWANSAMPVTMGAIGHVTQHSVLDVPPAAPRSLALAVSPNPARGAFAARFALPDDAPATLELLDVSGRRVWSREVRGAGPHTLSVGEGLSLAPGVYLARLSRGGEARTARVAILH